MSEADERNADFARMFRQESKRETNDEEKEDQELFNPMQRAAMFRRDLQNGGNGEKRQEEGVENKKKTFVGRSNRDFASMLYGSINSTCKKQEEVESKDTVNVGASVRDTVTGNGLGFQSTEPSQSSTTTTIFTTSSSMHEGNPLSSFGKRNQNSQNQKSKSKGSASGGMATWEKYTKGFGTKMLEKMGFSGRLGKDEKGVSSFIQVLQRPRQMGIGFGDFAEASALKQNQKLQRELRGETIGEEEIDSKQRHKRKLHDLEQIEDDTLWRKRETVPIAKRKYKKATDFLTQKKQEQVILDMRGPDVKILSNLTEAYNIDSITLEAYKPKLGDELIYNVHMVVNLTQGKIYDLTQKIESNTESIKSMRQKAKMIKNQLETDALQHQNLEKILSELNQLKKKQQEQSIDDGIKHMIKALEDIYQLYPNEFGRYKLSQLVPSMCIPALKKFITSKNFLFPIDCDEIVQQYCLIQLFFLKISSSSSSVFASTTINQHHKGGVFDHVQHPSQEFLSDDHHATYNYILEETLWPQAVQCINTQWQVENPEECIVFFEKLRPYLTSEFEEAFLKHVILPRIKFACQRWKISTTKEMSSKKVVLLHEWILPWDQILEKESMKSLYHETRHAISNVLNSWHPSDPLAIELIQPWRNRWGEHEYAKFTNRHVLRKLIRTLSREFEVNPKSQSLDVLHLIFQWKNVLPMRQYIALFDGEFFPKWLKTLHLWVSSKHPNLNELMIWYSQWRKLFEKHGILMNDRIYIHFYHALLFLDAICEQQQIPRLNSKAPKNYQEALMKAKENRGEEEEEENEQDNALLNQEKKKNSSHSGYVSLKDVIENLAINNNVIFMPKGFHDGQQVYLFGEKHIIIDQGVVFLENTKQKGSFHPIDVDQLL
jgi:tuftelin-interacting protein 11